MTHRMTVTAIHADARSPVVVLTGPDGRTLSLAMEAFGGMPIRVGADYSVHIPYRPGPVRLLFAYS